MSTYNEKGEEILDQTPVALPVGYKKQIPLNERIRSMVREEASRWAQENGNETFEEADDFNIADDPVDPSTPWEEDFDPEVKFIGAREAEIRHGQVQDFDEEKIHKGYQELEKHQKLSKSMKYKPKRASAKRKSEVEDEQEEEGTDE